MGPYDVDYTSLLLGVFSDWRVILAFVAFFLLGASLRYVGMVFSKPKINLPLSRKTAKKAAKAPPVIETEGLEEEE